MTAATTTIRSRFDTTTLLRLFDRDGDRREGTGDVMGAAYAAGHRNIATTAVYLHGQEKDAARMLATYAEKQAAHPNCGGGDDGDEAAALQETTETLVFKGFG